MQKRREAGRVRERKRESEGRIRISEEKRVGLRNNPSLPLSLPLSFSPFTFPSLPPPFLPSLPLSPPLSFPYFLFLSHHLCLLLFFQKEGWRKEAGRGKKTIGRSYNRDYLPYSRKYWRELYLADCLKMKQNCNWRI